MPHITLARLPLENLRRRPLRTAMLAIVVTMLTFAVYGGALLAANLGDGIDSMSERMGADLMVTPQNTGTQAEALLTGSSSGTFYFTNDIAALVSKADGVERATAQTYIASLSADCCDGKVQIIGFDPSTDFVIEPWIVSQYDGTLATGEAIAGSGINVSADGTIRLYGHEFPVVAQLAATGTGLDNAVFVDSSTVPQVIGYSAEVGHTAIPAEYADKAVSAVLVDVADGYDAHKVADNIAAASGLDGLGYVYPGGLTSTTRAGLDTIVAYAAAFLAMFWIMGLTVLIAVFTSATNERKREFAAYRIMGATRGTLVSLVVRESATIGFAGGVIGVALATLAIVPFSTLIASRLQLPYLQTGALRVLAMILLAVAFAVTTGVLACLASAVRLSAPETYLTLREGE